MRVNYFFFLNISYGLLTFHWNYLRSSTTQHNEAMQWIGVMKGFSFAWTKRTGGRAVK